MKKIALFIVLSIVFRPVFPVFDYLAHYNYIVNELCVNRDNPELQCNGKCYLIKELSKASSSEKSKGETKKRTSFELRTLFFKTTENTYIVYNFLKLRVQILYINLYTFLRELSYFHPPNNIV